MPSRCTCLVRLNQTFNTLSLNPLFFSIYLFIAPQSCSLTLFLYSSLSGNLSQGYPSLGPHFNPFGKTHGAPEDETRHVGSLGNITVGSDGKANVNITDQLVKLIGPQSVIGRSIVVYSGEDDMGKGGHENSLTNGNAGDIIGAGVIGLDG